MIGSEIEPTLWLMQPGKPFFTALGLALKRKRLRLDVVHGGTTCGKVFMQEKTRTWLSSHSNGSSP